MSLYKVIHGAASVLTGISLLGLASTASAAVVAYKHDAFVYGSTPYYSSEDFTISESQAGTYTATLTDFSFPHSLQTLEMTLTDPVDHEVKHLTGPGTFTFNATPGLYTANVYGISGGSLQLGLYGLSVVSGGTPPAPVALPPALILLASALLVFGCMTARCRGRVVSAVPA